MSALGATARCVVAGGCLVSAIVAAEPLADPPVLESSGGSLEVLMVAREQRLTTLPGRPVGWVYEICRYRSSDGPRRRCPGPGLTPAQLTACPGAGEPGISPYGGVRLQLEPGDTLRVRLVNCLPRVARDHPFAGEFKHVGEGGETLLQFNPTNLHTHGLLVEPRCATPTDDTYGDWIFVLAMNPANDFPRELIGRSACQATAPGAARAGHGHHSMGFDITGDGVVSYRIPIPKDHPSGLYWVHPHAHGLALNQVAAGLAIPLTIGRPDYLCGAPGCSARGGAGRVRHLVLKDAQVMPDGRLRLQETWPFCGKPDPSETRPRGKGGCPGAGPEYVGGTWAITVNGQVDPGIELADQKGEVWRILNASGSATHWLALQDTQTGVDLPVQVLSVDGVSLEVPARSTLSDLQARLGKKMKVVTCPTGKPGKTAVCADRILMMPSSRVEIGVTPPGTASRRAILRTYDWNTGPAGDTWPGVELASVGFPQGPAGATTPYVQVRGQSRSLVEPGGLLTKTMRRTGGAAPVQARCQPAPPGWVRQIVFGAPDAGIHALGYRLVEEKRSKTPPDDLVLSAFDHAADPTVCVPLGPGDRPVNEVWELVNVSGEDHNFHIHQTRFEVLGTDSLADGSVTPEQLSGARVLHDNVPVPRGGAGCDGTVAAWKRGACVPSRVMVRIPFVIPGDFVYHCHILGHEDAGMMAKISVVPASMGTPEKTK
jgi:FtsP/CotA-like multicopper oxidase with cupredoxin domain